MAEWKHGLCGCFDNCGLCLISFLCPCYTAGKNAEAVGESCFLCGLVLFVPVADIICPAMMRQKIREQKGIDGSLLGDIMAHWCCPCCAIVQSAQEVRDGAPAEGVAMSLDRE